MSIYTIVFDCLRDVTYLSGLTSKRLASPFQKGGLTCGIHEKTSLKVLDLARNSPSLRESSRGAQVPRFGALFDSFDRQVFKQRMRRLAKDASPIIFILWVLETCRVFCGVLLFQTKGGLMLGREREERQRHREERKGEAVPLAIRSSAFMTTLYSEDNRNFLAFTSTSQGKILNWLTRRRAPGRHVF